MEVLTVAGKLDALEQISKYVMAAANAAGLDKKASYKLRLAVDEIATNIIVHGYEENNLEGSIDVQAALDDRSLRISLEDTALPYDPYESEIVEESEFEKPLHERKIGGMGIYLALQGVDKFLYEREEGKNRNIFVVHLNHV